MQSGAAKAAPIAGFLSCPEIPLAPNWGISLFGISHSDNDTKRQRYQCVGYRLFQLFRMINLWSSGLPESDRRL